MPLNGAFPMALLMSLPSVFLNPVATSVSSTNSSFHVPSDVPVDLKQLRCAGTPLYTVTPAAFFFHRTAHDPALAVGSTSCFQFLLSFPQGTSFTSRAPVPWLGPRHLFVF